MSAVRVIKPEPELSAFTPEQREQLLAFHDAKAERVGSIFEAIYRACIGIARAIKPDRRWDGL